MSTTIGFNEENNLYNPYTKKERVLADDAVRRHNRTSFIRLRRILSSINVVGIFPYYSSASF